MLFTGFLSLKLSSVLAESAAEVHKENVTSWLHLLSYFNLSVLSFGLSLQWLTFLVVYDSV